MQRCTDISTVPHAPPRCMAHGVHELAQSRRQLSRPKNPVIVACKVLQHCSRTASIPANGKIPIRRRIYADRHSRMHRTCITTFSRPTFVALDPTTLVFGSAVTAAHSIRSPNSPGIYTHIPSGSHTSATTLDASSALSHNNSATFIERSIRARSLSSAQSAGKPSPTATF